MNKQVLQTFRELREEARDFPHGGCDRRASALAEKMVAEGIPAQEISQLMITLRSKKRSLRPSTMEGVLWCVHYVIEHQGIVYDPLFGKPLPRQEYLNRAFIQENERTLRVRSYQKYPPTSLRY